MTNQSKGNRKRPGREATYDDAFKIAVVTEYLKGELGYRKLAHKYKLPSDDTVRHFVKWYKVRYGPEAVGTPQEMQDKVRYGPEAVGTPQEMQADCSKNQEVSAREAELKRELEQARMKIVGLQTLIAVASQELGVDIAKKAGAKQSKS